MDHVVDFIFASRIAVGVEVAVGIIGAGKDGETNWSAAVVFVRRGLGAANRREIAAAANVELVVVRCVRLEPGRFDL